jgi:serine/threonine protein kinase
MFAAPEQVFGDRLDQRADVYAFGVTLYLLFVYDRVPSILDGESSASQAMQQVLNAQVRRVANFLESKTVYGGISKKAMSSKAPWTQQMSMQQAYVPSAGAARNETEVLGAKYFFSAELERIAGVNRRLDLTREILAVVSEATEIEPEKRPPDGAALEQRMSAILERAR